MPHIYPPIEPYYHGLLDVGDGHRIYWETCGNPNGKPAVVLHGGPGSGCSAGNRRPFNPDAYHRLLMSPDPEVNAKAACDWCDWEIAIVAVHQDQKPSSRYEHAAFRLAFARIVTHYFRNDAWIEDGRLLCEADRLGGIHGVLIHGRLDLGCPLITPWRLSQVWPNAELVVVNEAGHNGGDPGMTEALVAATDRFANIAI